MSNIYPAFYDRVRYTLNCKELDAIIITAPIGWNDDQKEYARHEQYHGVIAKMSNSLKFIGDGADYIQLVLDLYGINHEIQLIREERHPKTDVWTLDYQGFLDLSTWTRENNQVSVKFNSGGLEQLLKARESEKVELDRLTTIDGDPLPQLDTIDVELEGRRIFLKSQLEAEAIDNNTIRLDRRSSDGNFRSQTGAIPFKIVSKSHEEVGAIGAQAISDDKNVGVISQMIFFRAIRQKSVYVKIQNLEFTTDMILDRNIRDETNSPAHYRVSLCVYDENYAIKSRTNLFYANRHQFPYMIGSSDPVAVNNLGNYSTAQIHKINFEKTLFLAVNDNISLECAIEGRVGAFIIDTKNITGKIFFEEDSFFENTTAKSILAHEAGERLVAIATNEKSAFYSDFLGKTDTKNIEGNLINYKQNGKGSLTAITHGFAIRGFEKLPIPTEVPTKIENLFKPLTTSFKDYFLSLDAAWNLGVGIEKIGYSERVRVEELSYFYNKNVTIKLPNQVKNVKRSIAIDKYYSSLEFGYNEGGNYEEACGLDEFNAKSNFTTVINRLKNTFIKVSEYRADSYGMEFTRRKQKSLNDTQDTSGDNSIWFLDLIHRGKTIANNGITKLLFQQRLWQDDFEDEPTGVFSPTTATNLRLSPFNCLLRHSWWFSGGLKKYATDFVRYGSSTANSQLKTLLRTDGFYTNSSNSSPGNGYEYSENGNIVNSELQNARFLPEEIEFEHICDFDVMQMVNETTTILGKKIINFYGLVEFLNEKNEIEKGFLLNLKPNGKGQWKILKSNI